MLGRLKVVVCAALLAGVANAATISIETVAIGVSGNRGAVPGRPGFVFWGESNVRAPAINDAGVVVFRARSASPSSPNTGAATGLYIKRPGDPLDVIVDTTTDVGGNGIYPVPGFPAARFLDFEAPLISNNGDIVFLGRFFDSGTGTGGEGYFATQATAGSPVTKIVATGDPVPNHPGAVFEDFDFVTVNPETLGISYNDVGQVVYWAEFTVGTLENGIFGTTLAGGPGVNLADSAGGSIPAGKASAFNEIRPQVAINSSGTVAFIGRLDPAPVNPGGVYRVPVTGGVAPATVAFRLDPVPPDFAANLGDVFDDVDINDAGEVLFLAQLTNSERGLYAGTASGGPLTRVVDTRVGGLAVPGDQAGAEFDTLAFANFNNAGKLGFFSFIRNSATSNNQGIYAADSSGSPITRILDASQTAPGQAVGARITNFQGRSAAVNQDGHMAFWGAGIRPEGAGFVQLLGLYFYDVCTQEVNRVADSTTAPIDLGGTFSTSGTQTRRFALYQRGEHRGGHYRAINGINEVSFAAQFSNSDFGVYIARANVAGGGALSIECPAGLALECPSAADPALTGEATASGCGTITVTYADVFVPACGASGTLTRTWTASDGTNSVSCDQIIEIVDTLSPAATCPADALALECPADTSAAALGSATGSDDCGATTASYSDATVPGCGLTESITRTWTVTDECLNSDTCVQSISTVDTTPPAITCPPDALGLECPADTSTTALGTATAGDACGGAIVAFSDTVVPGCGVTESITRAWTATDDCGNASGCSQAISTADTTPPVITVDATPIIVVDTDCGGDESVTLPTATAGDDCDGAVPVVNNAPATFPAGVTTTVTYSTADDCGNAAFTPVDVTVAYGANILIEADRHTVGGGTYPGANKEPLVGIDVCAYDKSDGSCSRTVCGGISHHHYECIATQCPATNCCTTDANGECTINLPPGDYVVISLDATKTVLPDPLGVSASDLMCGDLMRKYLKQIVRADGVKKPGKVTRLTGSELLIIEPEFVVWDETEQLYPFVLESIGDWNVTVSVAPPEGFVADYPALTENVDSELEAVQFTIVEVGSDLVPTRTTFDVTHNGRRIKVKSDVDILLTPSYARSRGFDVAELKGKKLIVTEESQRLRRATEAEADQARPVR